MYLVNQQSSFVARPSQLYFLPYPDIIIHAKMNRVYNGLAFIVFFKGFTTIQM